MKMAKGHALIYEHIYDKSSSYENVFASFIAHEIINESTSQVNELVSIHSIHLNPPVSTESNGLLANEK